MTPCDGLAISARAAISPGELVPSSSTSTSVSGAASRMVMGTPRSLLKEALGAWDLQLLPRIASIMAQVVVLPTLPVTATAAV